MIAPLESTVVMPTWVFLFLFLGGLALLTFLMWANSTQAQDLRRQRREIHRLRALGLADGLDARVNQDSGEGPIFLIPAQRDGSGS